MKYFTKEELDDIANELINNPSKETLKRLNDKYNGSEGEPLSPSWIESSNSNQTVVENNSMPNQMTANEDFSIKAPIPSATLDIPTENSSIYKSNVSNNQDILNPSLSEPITNLNIQSEPIPNLGLLNSDINNIPVQNFSNVENNLNTIPITDLNTQNAEANNAEMPMPNMGSAKETPSSFELPNMGSMNNNNNNNHIPFNGNLWDAPNNNINPMMQTTDNFNNNMDNVQRPNNGITNNQPFFDATPSNIGNPIPVSEPPKEQGPTLFSQFEQSYNNTAQ